MKSKFLSLVLVLGFSVSVLSSPPASAEKLSSKCSKLNSKSWDGDIPIVCLKVSGKLKWQKFSTAPATPTKSAVPSEADKLVKKGCSELPSAIQNYSRSSGSTFNAARMRLDLATDSIWDAGMLDSKYAQLKTAQKIITDYVQAVGWDGQGYFGDPNTVRMAIATFNSFCGSKLNLL